MTPEEEKYVQTVENELESYRNQPLGGTYAPQSASAMFGGTPKGNIVEYQIEFDEELADIERLLRGDILQRDDKGNIKWIRNPDETRVIFNDLGVQDITREIRMVLNKNTILSNNREEQVIVICKMLGNKIRKLIYNNYEFYGMDNEYKQNNYEIIVITIVCMVSNAYRRSIGGETAKHVNQNKIVTQNESLNPMMAGANGMGGGYSQNSNKGGISGKWWNPLRLLGGS